MRPLSPIVRATYQAAILSGISNILAQLFQARRSGTPFHLDPLELLRFILVTLITCPPNFHWQQYLERTFPAYITPASHHHGAEKEGAIPLDEKRRDSNVGDEASRDVSGVGTARKPKINWRNTFTKMFIDCITIGALVNTVAFLVLMGVMKGQGWEKLVRTVKRETFPVIISGYKLWPMVSFLSFTFVPVDRRVVFFSAFGLGWNIYMSLVAAAV